MVAQRLNQITPPDATRDQLRQRAEAAWDSDEEEPHNPPCLHGRLWFSLLYNSETSKLEVTLIKAKYLPGRGLVNAPRDPFVKVFLLPDEENFHQSKIRKRTLTPKFNETFEFNFTKIYFLNKCGCGSLVVKITDLWLMFLELEHSIAKDSACRGAQTPSRWCDVGVQGEDAISNIILVT
ncbi:synaptotagmin-15 [Trichonephila clavipes]|nr:synaptotagmin-15 [Trichonephila clavipes]